MVGAHPAAGGVLPSLTLVASLHLASPHLTQVEAERALFAASAAGQPVQPAVHAAASAAVAVAAELQYQQQTIQRGIKGAMEHAHRQVRRAKAFAAGGSNSTALAELERYGDEWPHQGRLAALRGRRSLAAPKSAAAPALGASSVAAREIGMPNWPRRAENAMGRSGLGRSEVVEQQGGARGWTSPATAKRPLNTTAGKLLSPHGEACLDGSTRRIELALEHAHACASQVLGASSAVRATVEEVTSARLAAVEVRCAELEAEGLLEMHGTCVFDRNHCLQELSNAIELSKSSEQPPRRAEVEPDVSGAGMASAEGLRFDLLHTHGAGPVASRKAARWRKESARSEIGLHQSLNPRRQRGANPREKTSGARSSVGDVSTTMQSAPPVVPKRSTRSSSALSPMQRPPGQRARTTQLFSCTAEEALASARDNGADATGALGDLLKLATPFCGPPPPLLRLLSASARGVRADGGPAPAPAPARSTSSEESSDGDATDEHAAGGAVGSMLQSVKRRHTSKVFELEDDAFDPTRRLETGQWELASKQRLVELKATAEAKTHTRLVQQAAEKAMRSATETVERERVRFEAEAAAITKLEAAVETVWLSEVNPEAREVEIDAVTVAADKDCVTEVARAHAKVEMARERDQLSAALEVTENEWAEARAEVVKSQVKAEVERVRRQAVAQAAESQMRANEKVEVKAAQTRRAAATAEQRAKAAEVTAAAEATATAASAAAAKEIERMRRLLSATAENARNAASSDLAAARRVAEAAKRTAQAARSRAERDAAQMRKAREKKESQIEAFVEKPRLGTSDGLEGAASEVAKARAYADEATAAAAERVELAVIMGTEVMKAALATAQEEVAVSQRAAVEFIERAQRMVEQTRMEAAAAVVAAGQAVAAGAVGHVERRRSGMETVCQVSELAIAKARERAEAAVTIARRMLVSAWQTAEAMLESSRHQALEAHLTARTLWQAKSVQSCRDFWDALGGARDDLERERQDLRDAIVSIVEEMQGRRANASAATRLLASTIAEADAALAAVQQQAASMAAQAERAKSDLKEIEEGAGTARQEAEDAQTELSQTMRRAQAAGRRAEEAAAEAERQYEKVERRAEGRLAKLSSVVITNAKRALNALERAQRDADTEAAQAERAAGNMPSAREEADKLLGTINELREELAEGPAGTMRLRRALLEAEARAEVAESRAASNMQELKATTRKAMEVAQIHVDQTVDNLREQLHAVRSELAEERELRRQHAQLGMSNVLRRSEYLQAQKRLSARAEVAEARLSKRQADSVAAASRREALKAEPNAAASVLEIAETQRAAILAARLERIEGSLRETQGKAHLGSRDGNLDEVPLAVDVAAATTPTMQSPFDAAPRAAPPAVRVHENAAAGEAALVAAQLAEQLAVARAERAERRAIALETREQRV